MAKIAEAFVEVSARNSKLKRGLKQSVTATERASAQMSKAFSRIAAVAGPVALFAGLVKAIKSTTSAYLEQERADALLAARLQSLGDNVATVLPRLKAHATAIQRVTKFGDEYLLTLFAQIRAYGIQADEIPDVARVTLGLADAFGISNQAAARYVSLAIQGEFTMLRRYIPALRQTADAQKQLAIVIEAGNRGFDAIVANSRRVEDRIVRLKNSFGDLQQAIAGALLGSTTGTVAGGIFGALLDQLRFGIDALANFITRAGNTIETLAFKMGELVGAAIKAGIAKGFGDDAGFAEQIVRFSTTLKEIRDLILRVGSFAATAGVDDAAGGGGITGRGGGAARKGVVGTIGTATGQFKFGFQNAAVAAQKETTKAVEDQTRKMEQGVRDIVSAVSDNTFSEAFT
jgi:hypothetical protein